METLREAVINMIPVHTCDDSKLVPFNKMPKNIEELLSKHDYMFAMLNPRGMMRGIFETIHLNVNHPQWNNIVIKSMTDIKIYTTDGWKKKSFEDVWHQFHDEYINCFAHVFKNKDNLFPV
jgi:hypothetical protein